MPGSIEDWDDILPKTIKVPLTVYKHRHEIQKWWTKLIVLAGKGDTNVVVTGRATVGKSVLTAQLHGEASAIAYVLPQPSTSVETEAIQLGEWTKIVRVIPGQTS